ncbi:MAG: molybdopterin-synthase adenylyltransferase MoeB [Gemmatimonadota bacterium]|nr:molybdenum cofactor biosynthesis protein MoeB [Gemmatimonadota bacterium]MDP6529673.1 molybdopterin-synthase adenylyltransferase MoeB [Gemmatimonadota bacterium]
MSPPDSEQTRRYARHLVLPEVGREGQEALGRARVLCVGAGGLGSPLALYLAAAGIGTLGIIDHDRVDETNLQRQVIHGTPDIGLLKTDSAASAIDRINPGVRVVRYPERLDASNVLEILADYDLVADGTDNFPTRYLVNDACVLAGKANVYGSVFRFEGQAAVFCDPDGPCYRCLYPQPPPPGMVPDCATGGVLGVLPGLIGMIQATEVVKRVIGIGEPLVGRLILYDALSMTFRDMKIRRDPGCPVCGKSPRITRAEDLADACGAGAESPSAGPDTDLSVEEVSRRLESGEDLVLLDVRMPEECGICSLPGAVAIPLPHLTERVGELDPAREVIVYCHVGIRSAHAAGILRSAGFRKVWNLAGGIDAWSDRVDSTIPRY